MDTAAIILAAGRGSRMGALTSNHPKCMTVLGGKPLLEWQLQSLRTAGVKKILVVRGYLADCIHGDFETVDNPRWECTNMLSSLLCASAFIEAVLAQGIARVIVSYSDIVYNSSHITDLLATREDIAITYDTQWEKLWRLRLEDVLSDAETFLQENGRLVEIGGKPKDMNEIHGQYMGLISFNAAGWNEIKAICGTLGEETDKTDMTTFISMLLARGVPVGAVAVDGKWCETDNGTDLQRYEQALLRGNWSHDWR